MDWGQEKVTAEDEMAGWHHRLNGHGFGWTPGVGDGQGSLACCSPWNHRVKGFSIVHEADVFMEFSCFFYDLADVGNLISGSSAFSKTSLNTWKFVVHILLKPGVKNFEHYFTSV